MALSQVRDPKWGIRPDRLEADSSSPELLFELRINLQKELPIPPLTNPRSYTAESTVTRESEARKAFEPQKAE